MSIGEGSLTERVLRRDRRIVIAGLAAMTLLSWLYILAGAGSGVSVWHMAATSMAGMAMPPPAWTSGYWLLMLVMWWIMMIAMMTPSAAPMILLYARATRHAQNRERLRQGALPTAAFAAGYLLAWLGFSVIATALMWALERAGLASGAGLASSSRQFSAAVLMFAGLYQLSALKRRCLQHCRSPADFIARHWKPGVAGALRMGLEHGAFCVGCCWVLMTLLFVGGVMNVLWIAALTLCVILEKILARGPWLGRTCGACLLAWGALTLVV